MGNLAKLGSLHLGRQTGEKTLADGLFHEEKEIAKRFSDLMFVKHHFVMAPELELEPLEAGADVVHVGVLVNHGEEQDENRELRIPESTLSSRFCDRTLGLESAAGGTRTPTGLAAQRILSPWRLPFRHDGLLVVCDCTIKCGLSLKEPGTSSPASPARENSGYFSKDGDPPKRYSGEV